MFFVLTDVILYQEYNLLFHGKVYLNNDIRRYVIPPKLSKEDKKIVSNATDEQRAELNKMISSILVGEEDFYGFQPDGSHIHRGNFGYNKDGSPILEHQHHITTDPYMYCRTEGKKIIAIKHRRVLSKFERLGEVTPLEDTVMNVQRVDDCVYDRYSWSD